MKTLVLFLLGLLFLLGTSCSHMSPQTGPDERRMEDSIRAWLSRMQGNDSTFSIDSLKILNVEEITYKKLIEFYLKSAFRMDSENKCAVTKDSTNWANQKYDILKQSTYHDYQFSCNLRAMSKRHYDSLLDVFNKSDDIRKDYYYINYRLLFTSEKVTKTNYLLSLLTKDYKHI